MAATKHMQTEGNGAPYRVPPEPKRWPAIGMAVGVHALLIAFLVIGVNWQNHEPIAVEAEVWDVNTQTAAPPPPQPAPEPEPDTPPPPPQPAPKVVEPPPPVEQPVVKQPKAPDIALEREKKHKEELKQQKLEQEQERIEHERELADQKRADDKKARALADKKERELEQKQAEQKAREDAEKKAQEQAKKDAAEKKKADKEKADKLAKEKAEKAAKEKAEAARLDKARADEMKRMMSAAGNTGSTGNADKSTAPHRDNGYIAAITAKVKGNAHYGGSLDEPGNPTVSFHVEQLPTGEIISVRMTRGSGIPSFDEAVKRAIDASSPLPKKKDGTVERSLEINFHMKDMQ